MNPSWFWDSSPVSFLLALSPQPCCPGFEEGCLHSPEHQVSSGQKGGGLQRAGAGRGPPGQPNHPDGPCGRDTSPVHGQGGGKDLLHVLCSQNPPLQVIGLMETRRLSEKRFRSGGNIAGDAWLCQLGGCGCLGEPLLRRDGRQGKFCGEVLNRLRTHQQMK